MAVAGLYDIKHFLLKKLGYQRTLGIVFLTSIDSGKTRNLLDNKDIDNLIVIHVFLNLIMPIFQTFPSFKQWRNKSSMSWQHGEGVKENQREKRGKEKDELIPPCTGLGSKNIP